MGYCLPWRKDKARSPLESDRNLMNSLEILYSNLQQRLKIDIDGKSRPDTKLASYCDHLVTSYKSLVHANGQLQHEIANLRDLVNTNGQLQHEIANLRDLVASERRVNDALTYVGTQARQEAEAAKAEKNNLEQQLKEKAVEARSLADRHRRELGQKEAQIISQTQQLSEKARDCKNLNDNLLQQRQAILDTEEKHRKAVLDAERRHKDAVSDADKEHRAAISDAKKKHDDELADKQSEIAKLESSLATLKSTWSATSDRYFEGVLASVNQKIQRISFMDKIPLGGLHSTMAAEDQTGFLSGKQGPRPENFIKHLIWRHLARAFFTRDGFGLLGPGSALAKMHCASVNLLGEADVQDTVLDLDLVAELESTRSSLQTDDHEVAEWRFATLELICQRMSPADTSELGAVYRKHETTVASDLLATLRRIASPHRLSDRLEADVRAVTEQSASLALRMATQRARVVLFLPARGTRVGRSEFWTPVDAANREQAGAAEIAVAGGRLQLPERKNQWQMTPVIDQVLCPSLRRIGDGESDLTTVFKIASGEAYLMPAANFEAEAT